MLILGLDTSSAIASLALVRLDASGGADAQTLGTREAGSNRHAEELIPLLASLLGDCGIDKRDIDAIAVGAGPGSFTGLRIGMATAKGLAFALQRPLWAVSSLAAFALEIGEAAGVSRVAALLDARRSEVFVGCFEVRDGTVHPVDQERVLPPAEVAAAIVAAWPQNHSRNVLIAGEGLTIYRAELGDLSPVGRTTDLSPDSAKLNLVTPTGAGVARLAARGSRIDSVTGAVPAYIRPAEAEIKFPKGNPGGTFSPGS